MTVSGSKPRVSIGLPVFNGEKFLPDTLDSILTQTYSDFELIISDNASTDKTGQICRDYAAKDQRICYYRNEENIVLPRITTVSLNCQQRSTLNGLPMMICVPQNF